VDLCFADGSTFRPIRVVQSAVEVCGLKLVTGLPIWHAHSVHGCVCGSVSSANVCVAKWAGLKTMVLVLAEPECTGNCHCTVGQMHKDLFKSDRNRKFFRTFIGQNTN